MHTHYIHLSLSCVFLFQVYSLVLPKKELAIFVDNRSRVGLILLILIMTTTVISIFGFVFIVIRATKREMHLCAKLIQQMEATQQAERKSMNKSVAFTRASHDIRASLSGIDGLIKMCYNEAAPGSELDINLKQMDGCTKDLLGNSYSKPEHSSSSPNYQTYYNNLVIIHFSHIELYSGYKQN